MAIQTVEIDDFSSCTGYTPPSWVSNVTLDAPITKGYDFCNKTTVGEEEVFNNGVMKITFTADSSDPQSIRVYVYRYDNADNQWKQTDGFNARSVSPSTIYLGILFAIDDSDQLGNCYWYIEIYYNNVYTYYIQDGTHGRTIYTYNAIKGSMTPPIVNNWQSVPSINGKNGTLQLSTHNDINDGEPITTQDETKITLQNNSNVGTIVTNVINNW